MNDRPSHESQELFNLIVENVKDYAIFATDAEGRVVSWNPGVKRLLGYDEAEIVGQPIAVIFTPEDIEGGAHMWEMETAAREGRVEDQRWHVRKDGTRFWANGLVMPLRDDGGLRGFAKVMRDDTERKRLENERKELLTRADSRARITVSDTGKGIGADELPVDFTPLLRGFLMPPVGALTAGREFRKEWKDGRWQWQS